MSSKNTTERRARNWCAVVYPESAPNNWQDILDAKNLKWSCSPLHDQDVDDDGVIKKAHWHIIICYSGNKSFSQVCDDLDGLNCPIPQICRDVRSSVRYFIHLDHPHKFQYSMNDIKSFGGFDIGDALSLSKTQKTEIFKEIITFIRDNNITEFYDLVNYALDERPEDWFPVLTDSGTIMLREYIKSNRHKQ